MDGNPKRRACERGWECVGGFVIMKKKKITIIIIIIIIIIIKPLIFRRQNRRSYISKGRAVTTRLILHY